jgi:hypothetical protein
VTIWTDQTYQPALQATAGTFPYPNHSSTEQAARDATVFTRRGDYQSHGWLAAYNTTSPRS